MRQVVLAVFALLIVFGTGPAFAGSSGLADAQIRQQIVQDSVADYLASGHPCACPYNAARNGSQCGGRSAYSRPNGAAPLCYPSDVTLQMVQEWKQQHPAAGR